MELQIDQENYRFGNMYNSKIMKLEILIKKCPY